MVRPLKTAIIVGSEGQDGRLLFDRLRDDGWIVLGVGRDCARVSSGQPEFFDIASIIEVARVFEQMNPDAVFYLPAVHASADTSIDEGSDSIFRRSLDVHVQFAVNFLEVMSVRRSDAAFFYAGSSHVFAGAKVERQTELTPLAPDSIYGITKAAGIQACRFYRSRKGVRASAGILYNHESHLRGPGFVSQRIVNAAVRASRGEGEKLALGDLSACVDWGYAPDYVDAMIRISELPDADDYIIATGQPHTVREFVEEAFECVGLDWHDFVIEQPSLLARRPSPLVGDYTRLNERIGWHPTVSFRELVRRMVDHARKNAA
ncbi:MAG TPA: GDP-mannose 4,6-dehydratase [Gemmatimonadaceae bacterium]